MSHVTLQVTPDPWPSCFSVLLPKPNFLLPVSHTLAPNRQMKRPDTECLPEMCLACRSSSDWSRAGGGITFSSQVFKPQRPGLLHTVPSLHPLP